MLMAVLRQPALAFLHSARPLLIPSILSNSHFRRTLTAPTRWRSTLTPQNGVSSVGGGEGEEPLVQDDNESEEYDTTDNILLLNNQSALLDLDESELRRTVSRIRALLGYEKYGVSLMLVDDEEMRQTNLETRGVDGPTDILSFPLHEAVEPGILEEPPLAFRHIPDYYHLGEMMVDVPYVIRQCREDMEWEYEDDEEDRGVSAAMSEVFDPEKRIHMLLIHGMLHLVGHDHMEDDEFELMVSREEKMLEQLSLVPDKNDKNNSNE